MVKCPIETHFNGAQVSAFANQRCECATEQCCPVSPFGISGIKVVSSFMTTYVVPNLLRNNPLTYMLASAKLNSFGLLPFPLVIFFDLKATVSVLTCCHGSRARKKIKSGQTHKHQASKPNVCQWSLQWPCQTGGSKGIFSISFSMDEPMHFAVCAPWTCFAWQTDIYICLLNNWTKSLDQ